MNSRSAVQTLLDELLWDLYGRTSRRGCVGITRSSNISRFTDSWKYSQEHLLEMNILALTQLSASLRIEIRIIGSYLTRVLVARDKYLRVHEEMCSVITAYLTTFSLQLYTETKEMRFSLSPPPPQLPRGGDPDTSPSSSDFDQWLHAMKMVARLPGGMPPEFRRKLWLALSEKYLQTRNVSWEQEEAKCFSEQWREDDEELGIQIVKDLHRTGSSLCSGPGGTINQAKLKRVLLGYARWNPEVGYCQGFNMLGALILQVMDKSESESMKVMIFLIEGVLPPGYFSGSLGGLQADMAVFRELMTTKLPKLAKHLQKLQGRNPEDSFEPPLTNVFTMQWFLTLFCTCLPINCVFRVWDLTLIEGSDVLLRTALAIWSLLEDKILCSKTADDFYCKMGTLSGELLNGHLIDSNGLIEKVVELGPVSELQKLRDKHLYNIAPWRDQKGLKLYYSDEDGDSDDDSRLAVTTAWGLRLNRRGSIGIPTSSKQITENKDRLALDISLLKKQYERLRERQRQAHIIITATVARQAVSPMPTPSLQVNQLLMGRPPIISNRARLGPPKGSIPPPRKVPGPSKPIKPVTKQTKRGETLHWRDTEVAKRRKGSIKWKDVNIPSYDETDESDEVQPTPPPPPPPPPPPILTSSPARSRRKSESSSYSEDSDPNSSTSTSLCDEDDNENADTACSSLEASPRRKLKTPDNEVPKKDDLGDISKFVSDTLNDSLLENVDRTTFGQIPLIELTGSKIIFDKNQEEDDEDESQISSTLLEEDSTTECDRFGQNTPLSNFVDLTTEADDRKSLDNTLDKIDSLSASLTTSLTSPIDKCNNFLDVSKSPLTITSTSQLSPIADISKYLSSSSISPLRTPTSYFDYADIATSTPKNNEEDEFNVNEDGVTNEYFERVSLERPTRLDLLYSYNEEKAETDKDEKALEEELATECNKEEQETKVINLDFEKAGLPSVTPEAQHSINCSLNIKTEEDTVVESLDTHSELKEHTECRASSSVGSIFNHSIGKEKSFSFDDTAVVEKFEPRPTSCPEARSNLMEEKTHSDRVLKIIEENSLILHRILRKSVPDGDSPTCNKENYEKIFAMPKIEKEASETVEKEYTKDSPVRCEIEIKENDDFMPLKKYDDHYEDKFTTSFRTHSRILDLSSIQLRSDDSIADRLASIKNTIKSIDSLCEDKESYKKEKCQKYIDSLFKTTSREPPSIKINEIESLTTATNLRASPILFSEGKSLNDSYSTQSRSYRDIRREISPRRRRDEDREEYESRARRDKMPNDSQREYELSSVNIFSKLDSKNEDLYEKIKCDKKFEDYRMDSDNSIASYTNHTVKGSEFDIQSAVPTVYVPAKINIRHTTVTSTFYDRYLSQKRERNATTKIDSNPLSPTITRSYLDTLKPTSNISYSRNTKSAENSPSREKFDSPIAYTTTPTKTSTNQSTYFHLPDNELHVRSCDNILLRLKTSPTSNITPSVATDIHQPQPIYNPLPTKVKKPSEIGIQLGLYKSPTNNFPTS